jgi:hypothetical protein
MPQHCPERGKAERCPLGPHRERDRKTVISWGFVVVAVCRTHRIHFTLDAPKHVPYGRDPLVEVRNSRGRGGLAQAA